MIARRVFISGRVQGVGFRYWMIGEAERLGLTGWVRNLRDGTVEALIEGDEAAVEEMLRLCRRGPPGAQVGGVLAEPAKPSGQAGFGHLPTV
jgi:acylphosphatase